MNILKILHSNFRIDANESKATQDKIDTLKQFSEVEVPPDYLDIVNRMTEVETLVYGEKYIRIWSPSGCIEMNEEYQAQRYTPQSLAIGDDEGGSALIFMAGKEEFGLYKVGFGDLDADDAEYIASSLEEFLTTGTGVEKI